MFFLYLTRTVLVRRFGILVRMNHSPWIVQLKRTRPVEPLSSNLFADTAIVGGGIAGITTAYFILTKTIQSVVLLEAGKVAHGATGHNAGQITSYFEKTFTELAERYGIVRTAAAQRAIEEDARALLEHIFAHAELSTPFSQFIGYDGLSLETQVLAALHDLYLKAKAGLRVRPLLIAKEWVGHGMIPHEYTPYTLVVAQENILSLLETTDTQYIAALPFLSGCMNSALFTEELTGYLLATFPERFTLKEHTPVSRVVLGKDEVLLHAGINMVTTSHVVLCTNGFESIQIDNPGCADIDTAFHMEVEGVVGYMAAYKEELNKAPFAGIYSHSLVSEANPYFYTTRRPFEDESNATHNLVCVGGPEVYLPDRATYDAHKEYPLEISDAIGTFSSLHYKHHPHMDYYWHGLMGYTKSWVRMVGFEPKNKRLLYNLGCNGVGILTSVYGSERIARLLNGELLAPTIFDPQ